jgi:hypothetical protein
MALIPVGNREADAKKNCIKLSEQNPGMYVIAVNRRRLWLRDGLFGLFAHIEKRLNVQAPGDTPFDWYILNGEVKQFTLAQVVANQNTGLGME